MPDQLPVWSLDLLPDDPALLADLKAVCLDWKASGLALHPTTDGVVTCYPRHNLTPMQTRLVERMKPYKPLILKILAAHPAIEILKIDTGTVHVICAACFKLIPLHEGQPLAHRRGNQQCLGLTPQKEIAS